MNSRTIEFNNEDDLSQISDGDLSFGDDDEDDISYGSDPDNFHKLGTADQTAASSVSQSDALKVTASSVVNELQTIHIGQIDYERKSSSSLPSSSSILKTKTVFDDPTFAPPPEFPKGIEKARIIAKTAPSNASPLPDPKLIAHSGRILARVSVRSIIMKKWKECFWITYGKSKVMLFRSKSDFDEWISNPYLTHRQRMFLVKLSIEFAVDFDNDIHMMGYKVTTQRMKYYNRQMQFLHQIKLEQCFDGVNVILAFFSSLEPKEVHGFHAILWNLSLKYRHPLLNQHTGTYSNVH